MLPGSYYWTVAITFDLTLNGESISSANTNDSDEGVVNLVDTVTGDVIYLNDAWDGALPNFPLTRRILPGMYDVHYSQDGAAAFWPINEDAMIGCVEIQ